MNDDLSIDGASGSTTPAETPAGIERILDAVVYVCRVITGCLLVFLIASFGWLVFGRYVLNNTPTWVEQSSLLIVAYISFLGAAIGARQGTHLSIDFIREAMPPLPRAILRVASELIMLAFGAFMAWQGWVLVSTNLQREIPLLGVSESWRAVPILICGVLLIAFCGVALVKRLRNPFQEE